MSAPRHVYRPRGARAVYEMHYGPNMTPMVDVVMVILVFFMASAVVLGPEWFIRTHLPRVRAASTQQPEREPLRITIWLERASNEAGTTLRINDEEQIDLLAGESVLRSIVASRPGEQVVVIVRADETVPYEDVVRVHALCHQLNIKKVGLVAESAKRSGEEDARKGKM